MGNELSPCSEDPYIQPHKINQSLESPPLNDITNKLEHIFGVSNIPLSHRANPSDSPQKRRAFESIGELNKLDKKDKQYEERISNLENQLYYLKSIISDLHQKSHLESLIRNQSQQSLGKSSGNESQYGNIFLANEQITIQEEKEEESMMVDAQISDQPVITQVEVRSLSRDISASLSRLSQTYFNSREHSRF